MLAAEAALQRALLATVAGNRTRISPEEVSNAIAVRHGLDARAFSVHRHHPDDLLVRFRSGADRARVAAANLRTPRFRLLFSPWSSMAGAEPVTARFRVSIEIVGIPDHGWFRSSAETLLAPFCYIERLAPETAYGSDMSVFRLTAWTANPDAIPRSSELLLPVDDGVPPDAAPDSVSRFALPLARFPVSIHVSEAEDYRFPTPPPPPARPDDGDDQAHSSPPPPAAWPQRHHFSPRDAHPSGRRREGGNRGGGRRQPPFRGYQGVLGPHPPIRPLPARRPPQQRLAFPLLERAPAATSLATNPARRPVQDPVQTGPLLLADFFWKYYIFFQQIQKIRSKNQILQK